MYGCIIFIYLTAFYLYYSVLFIYFYCMIKVCIQVLLLMFDFLFLRTVI
jgi:hypothetical protein